MGSGDQRHNILLADANPVVLKLLRTVLTDAGHEVVTTTDGSVVESLLEGGSFTLLIADEHLPGIRGSQLILQLRSKRVRIPAILMSASDVMSGSGFITSEDNVAILRKPFAFTKLHSAILTISPPASEELPDL